MLGSTSGNSNILFFDVSPIATTFIAGVPSPLFLNLTLKLQGRGQGYITETECRIDLKPGCKSKFFRCLEVYVKIDQYRP